MNTAPTRRVQPVPAGAARRDVISETPPTGSGTGAGRATSSLAVRREPDVESDPVGRGRGWTARPLAWTRALVGALVVLAMCLQQPTPEFLWDANHYWDGAVAILEGGPVFESGLLNLRGVVTSFLYLPAALAVKLAGGGGAAFAVLVQNALLIAVVGVLLLPRVVGMWRPITPGVIWVSGVGAALLLAGFAPFPLTDLWGAALLVVAVVSLDMRGPGRLLLGGIAAGLSFNVRPAALIAVAGLVLVVLIARRLRGLEFVGGIAMGLLPQFVLNRWHGDTWIPWPELTGALTQLQAGYASYIVRYDSVPSLNDSDPRRFFCSPSMAGVLDGEAPGSTGELAGTFLAHLPQSVVMSAQKVAAALHWPLSTPYAEPATGVNLLFALVVTGTAVTGAAVLLRATLRRNSTLTGGIVALWVAFGATVLTLATSATETRFALPLVLFGIAGCAALAGSCPPVSVASRRWIAGVVVAAVAVFGLGAWGLQHPISGSATVDTCAAA